MAGLSANPARLIFRLLSLGQEIPRSWVSPLDVFLRFNVLSDDLLRLLGSVPCWLNLSGGEKPFAGRRSRYFAEWIRANGIAPTRGDRLSPRVFVGRMTRVEIGDTDPTKSPVPYSVVRKILSWETGGFPGHSVSKSNSQGRHGVNAMGDQACKQ